ncbi:membrane protein insertase YidC [Arundinibacter roseus]|uniref:Membrane protein insertase YidC n=1 Tax=Arundinibacter roseus TaxID=2070510 RepID=A0A4V2X9P2_9BACT|nr:membrane protein insertase YidC [Arundinibacter roseus]TDB64595.1 membrane protein insertase YidC [Arundinibacter roseus]
MERNQVIGLVLILLMLIGYQVLVPQPEEPTPVAQEQVKPSSTTSPETPAEVVPDSAQTAALYGDFAAAATGESQDITIDTKDISITFSNKGGLMKEVLLKNYKTYDQKPLYLISEEHSRFQLDLPTQKGTINLANLYFSTSATSKTLSEKDSAVITYRLSVAENQFVEQTYVVRGSGFVIDYGIQTQGVGVPNKPLAYGWKNELLQLENDMMENRKVVTINYYTDEMLSLSPATDSNVEETAENPVKWFTMKHKYFLAGLIAGNSPLQGMKFVAEVNPADSTIVKTLSVEGTIPSAALQNGTARFQYFMGPNDYHIVREVAAEHFDDNVYLGYAFLKPINEFFLVPLFNQLEKLFTNYGLLIICLVFIVKLLLTPLTYKSYVSMAKMRVLAPELEELKKKNPDDMAKQQQDQMKLYQQVGVSPLSGCVPVLATMPILFSLFFLFPNLIELRQQSFLWANDLSTYDSFLKLPFTIPFYGDHVSLFTVLMTISSIGYAYFNNQMTPTQPGPVNMKFLSYLMPVMFMFVLNNFPAGLTFYYFVSNIATILQQQIIRRFVDEDKIKRILDENRVKNATAPKKQNKFQQYLEKTLQAGEEARKKQAELEKKQGKRK